MPNEDRPKEDKYRPNLIVGYGTNANETLKRFIEWVESLETDKSVEWLETKEERFPIQGVRHSVIESNGHFIAVPVWFGKPNSSREEGRMVGSIREELREEQAEKELSSIYREALDEIDAALERLDASLKRMDACLEESSNGCF